MGHIGALWIFWETKSLLVCWFPAFKCVQVCNSQRHKRGINSCRISPRPEFKVWPNSIHYWFGLSFYTVGCSRYCRGICVDKVNVCLWWTTKSMVSSDGSNENPWSCSTLVIKLRTSSKSQFDLDLINHYLLVVYSGCAELNAFPKLKWNLLSQPGLHFPDTLVLNQLTNRFLSTGAQLVRFTSSFPSESPGSFQQFLGSIKRPNPRYSSW